MPVKIVACLLLLVSVSHAEPWNQFRGPHGDGHSLSKDLPTSWSETKNVTWKVPIPGRGWSSPVVWGNQIWLTTAPDDGAVMSAICVDATTGKVVHNLPLFKRKIPVAGLTRNSYATPTPVIEEGRVYIHFGRHGTCCLDTKTGKKLWERLDVKCDHYRRPASSPIPYGDAIIVAFDGFDVQFVIAFDKQTGETLWKKDRNIDYGTDNGDLKKAFGTGSVVDVNGKPQLIYPSSGSTIAYNPINGEEIWRVRHGGMNAASRPIFSDGVAYINAPYKGFGLFAVRLDGTGNVTKSHVAWSFKKSVPKHASQLLVDGLIYMMSETGIATCVDAKTGEGVWVKRLGGKYVASPIYAAGKIYFFSEGGECPVIEPGREFKLLSENKLADGFMASPAVAEDAFIFRTLHHLYRVE